MPDICGICKRPELGDGEEFDEAKHCPDLPNLGRNRRDEVACLRLGCDLREEQLTRAKLLLRQCAGWLGLAAEELKRLDAVVEPPPDEGSERG